MGKVEQYQTRRKLSPPCELLFSLEMCRNHGVTAGTPRVTKNPIKEKENTASHHHPEGFVFGFGAKMN